MFFGRQWVIGVLSYNIAEHVKFANKTGGNILFVLISFAVAHPISCPSVLLLPLPIFRLLWEKRSILRPPIGHLWVSLAGSLQELEAGESV